MLTASGTSTAFVSAPPALRSAPPAQSSTAQPPAEVTQVQQPEGTLTRVAGLGLIAAGAVALAGGRRRTGTDKAQVRSNTVVKAFENELGVQAPTGFWDPAGFCNDGDERDFYRRRCVELKHGRVSMIACIGYIVPEYFKWPGYLSPSSNIKFADVPNGIAALTKVPAVGWTQIVFFGLAMELFAAYQDESLPPGKLSSRLVVALTAVKDWPNNYTFGPFGIPNAPSIADPEVRKKKLNAELANGRLAMVAIMAMLFQNGTVGTTGPEMWFPPPSAFENELGVQAPTGFWDPAGFCNDGDERDFYRRRCVELKHGRVSMIACIGYIVPEYFKWPGYLSPSSNIKFADVPNGIAALTKVPAVGWTQIVFFGLAMELFAAYQDESLPPGKLSSRLVVALTAVKDWPNNYTFGPFGIPNAPSIADPEVRKKKLNAELANGRLAMVAIMAMLFQNGTVGTTGPEMWFPPPSAFENELGVQAPTGFWDPAGFCNDGDERDFYRRRCVELKHGRVSMIACIGYIVPEYFKWPGYLSPSSNIKFADVPNGIAALTKVPAVGWTQIVFFGLAMELFAAYQDESLPPGKLSSRLVVALTAVKDWPNNYTFGPFGIPNAPSIADPEVRKKKLNAELANGRLAMVAIMAMLFQNGTVGTTGPEMWFPPPSAFENELGVQAPTGFWDPAGFCNDGDERDFYRRRCVELKHGRVSMIACIGYIVPEYFKWPGYLSPSSNIKFADVPNGIAALTKVPAVGWTQIVFFGLAMELFAAYQDESLPPGKLSSRLVVALTAVKDWPNNYTFGPFGIPNAPSIADPEVRKKKLNAELANGRLAMVAIMAMLFQNGTVGTTGPEMWFPPPSALASETK